MTREEAIKDIQENIKPFVGGKSLDMAIKALSQPIVCKDYCIDDDNIYCSPKVAERIVEALHADRPRWVPVTERLPEENGRDYLVTYNWTGSSGSVYTEVEIVEFRRGRWMISEENRVVAWCPLPEPWKGEAE